MSREDQYSVNLVVDGVDYGTFDKKTGGATEAEESKYRPGAMGKQESLGGAQTVENVTITRKYDFVRDHVAVPTLRAKCGRGRAVCTVQPLDLDGNAFGSPEVFTGILQKVQTPDVDSMSSDPGMLELEISTDGSVG